WLETLLGSNAPMRAMPDLPARTFDQASATVLPIGQMIPKPVTTTRRRLKWTPVVEKNQAFLEWAETYAIACCTVVIFSASSSGISVSNSSSRAITNSTVSRESAPRSSTNEDSFLISASFTPSCSATIFLTRCSTFSTISPCLSSPKGECGSETRRFYQNEPTQPAALPSWRPSYHQHAAVH